MKKQEKGFSLTEILLALLIVGIIYAVCLPMLATKQDHAVKHAVFKETLDILDSLTRQGVMKDELHAGNYPAYYVERINAVTVCLAGAIGDCYPNGEFNGPAYWLTLPNGAIIMDMDASAVCDDAEQTACGDNLSIDWNGLKPPNIKGVDVMDVMVSFGTEPWQGRFEPGQIAIGFWDHGVMQASEVLSQQLYKEVYELE